jgi:hypothetical protein
LPDLRADPAKSVASTALSVKSAVIASLTCNGLSLQVSGTIASLHLLDGYSAGNLVSRTTAILKPVFHAVDASLSRALSDLDGRIANEDVWKFVDPGRLLERVLMREIGWEPRTMHLSKLRVSRG